MKFVFNLLAAIMTVSAVLLIVRPMLRGVSRQRRSPGLLVTALAITTLLPITALCLYRQVGTPAALEADAAGPARDRPVRGASVDAGTQQEVRSWMERAQAFDAQQQPAEAREAYAKVLAMDAANTAAMVGWVEADMTQHAGYAIDDAARRLLERAIALDPDNQRALWLFGISQFQQGRYADASATWRHLQQRLDAGSALAQAVAQQIAKADAMTSASAPH